MTPLSLLPAASPTHGLAFAIAGAVALGVTGSLHCFAMCGPLACSALPGQSARRTPALLGYHLARSGTYALEGGLVGALGQQVFRALPFDVRPWAGWMVVALLVASALDLWRRVPSFGPLRRVSARITRSGAALGPGARGAALGMATGLLPCGLLYGALGTALVASSFWGGAAVMLAFSLAGVPALLLAQLPFAAVFRAPRVGPWIRRGAPLLAAVLVLIRTVGAPAHAVTVKPNPTASMEGMENCPFHAHAKR